MLQSDTLLSPMPARGLTPREFAAFYRVGVNRVLGMIRSGTLGAINTSSARCSKARYVILPDHCRQFERGRSAATPAKPAKRKKKTELVDYFPD